MVSEAVGELTSIAGVGGGAMGWLASPPQATAHTDTAIMSRDTAVGMWDSFRWITGGRRYRRRTAVLYVRRRSHDGPSADRVERVVQVGHPALEAIGARGSATAMVVPARLVAATRRQRAPVSTAGPLIPNLE